MVTYSPGKTILLSVSSGQLLYTNAGDASRVVTTRLFYRTLAACCLSIPKPAMVNSNRSSQHLNITWQVEKIDRHLSRFLPIWMQDTICTRRVANQFQ